MRSFIRFNGVETSVENARIIDAEFNNVFMQELRKVFGEKSMFIVEPDKNFVNEEKTDTIFQGIITGQFESEAPIKIAVFINPVLDITTLASDEVPEPDVVVPAFLGFRK